MKLVYDFPHSMPVYWPLNHEQLTRLVEDGNEETLYIDYQDRSFRRPILLGEAEQLRNKYGKLRQN